MTLERKSLRLGWLVTAAFLAAATPIRADVVTATIGKISSGYYPYMLTVTDENCCLNVVGVILTHGFTVFDLDDSSTIGEPAGWADIPPIPGALDSLTWYDFEPSAAIVPFTPKGGFTFQSQTSPYGLAAGQPDVQLIYSDSSVVDSGDFTVVTPEPSAIILVGTLVIFLVIPKYLARLPAR